MPNVSTEAVLPRIIHALFPLGSYTVTLDRNTLEVTNEGYAHRDVIQKRNGSPVQTDVFLDPAHAPVSGVLFSYADVCNSPAILGADFVYCHNPLATNPLPMAWLRLGSEYWVENEHLRHQGWNQPGWGRPRWSDQEQ